MPQSAREPIITRSKDRSKKQEAQQAVVGEKHKTNRRSPEPKRTKTEKRASRKEVANNSNRKVESSSTGVESAVKPEEEPKLPNNILERGIVYFFIRGRVGIDKPSSVNEISRTHILLRPIANDAKLGKRPVADAGNTRLLALPRKVLPRSGKDRFMTFVEKSEASFKTIQDTFLEGSEYVTKTAGTRHDPPAIPVGEGVYAITTTGRESHLAYMLTLPEKLNEVQKELGLREKGSFIISTKNPTYEGPANVKFRNKPAFSKT